MFGLCGYYQNIKYNISVFVKNCVANIRFESETAARGVLHKKLFLEILQHSQENTCVRVLTQT